MVFSVNSLEAFMAEVEQECIFTLVTRDQGGWTRTKFCFEWWTKRAGPGPGGGLRARPEHFGFN